MQTFPAPVLRWRTPTSRSSFKLTKPAIDAPSVALSVVGFGGVVFGAGMASSYGWTSPVVLGALVAGIASLTLSSPPRELSADGSTALNTMQQVLGAVCTAVATSLLTAGQASYVAAGGTDATLAFMQGSHWGFVFALALAVVGFACALCIKVKKRVNVGTGEVAAANAADLSAARAAAKASAAGNAGSDGTSPRDAAKSGARA